MKSLLYFVFLGLLIGVFACKKSTIIDELPLPEPPLNPYSEIDYSEQPVPAIEVDSASFLGLHYFLFSNSCNQPACHDGTFEPDFRTLQSAYNSLVRHSVTKNYDINPLPFRVTPGEAQQSMLYHRITMNNPPNFEQMPSSGIPLPEAWIQHVRTWIEGGARDVFGELPTQTSLQPASYGVAAFLPEMSDFRIDTIRGGVFFNPFLAPADEEIRMSFLILDVTPAGDTIFGNTLTHNKIRFSTSPITFDNPVELSLDVPVFPYLIPSVLSQPFAVPLPYYQSVTFNPQNLGFQPGEVVYFRIYVRDSDHPQPTEIPKSDSQFPLQTYFSFVLY